MGETIVHPVTGNGNTNQLVLASAARTASVTGEDISNYNSSGAHIIVDISAISVATQLTATVQGKDITSGNYYDILITTALNVVDTFILKIHPGTKEVQNQAINDSLPQIFRINLTHSDGDSITYSVTVNFLT